MKLKKIMCGVAVALMLVVSVSCGVSEEEKIIGSWVYNSDESTVRTNAKQLTFYEGGACANSGESGTWEISNSTLQVMGTYGGQFFSHDNLIGTIEIKGDVMTIDAPCVDGDVYGGSLVYNKIG